jgi:hypothetical protein
MSRMIELVRSSAVPSNVMRSAARGALSLPSNEMIEILVHLTNNPVFAEQARMTLAGWDEQSSLAVAADPASPPEVLNYLAARENLRPRLLPALVENPSLDETKLAELAEHANHETIEVMLASGRLLQSRAVLHRLSGNPNLSSEESALIQRRLTDLGETPAEAAAEHEGRSQYEIDHADEILAEEGKVFRLAGDLLDLGFEEDALPAEAYSIDPASKLPVTDVSAVLKALAGKQPNDPQAAERVSVLQRIARLTVGERVQLAMKGSREERFVLIRDGARVVSCAVLESPKLTESEIEMFASMKNLQEVVLRTITMKRKFMKMYGVIRALVNNPKTPIDVSLPLMNHLLANDLKSLSFNKNVPDTVRTLALRRFNQKTGR